MKSIAACFVQKLKDAPGSLAEMADVQIEKMGPSTGKLAL